MKIKKLLMTLVSMVLAFGAIANLNAVEVTSKTTTKDSAPEVKVEKKTTTAITTTHSVNINTASREQLEALDGIGTIRAQKIIDSRPYKTVNDLIRADIPKSTIDKISTQLTVGNGMAATVKSEKKTNGILNRSRVNEPSGAEVKVDTTPRVKVENTPRISVSRVPSGARVNINTATKAELEALPEIGPIKAQAIIENRPFKSAEDIMRVPGIKESTFDTIKSSITVK